MGNYLNKPKTEKQCRSGEGNGLRYGVCSMQGWREEMEDAEEAVTGLGEGPLASWSFFGVFDGHAGHNAAQIASRRLLENVLNTDEFKKADYEKGIRTGFLKLDKELSSIPSFFTGEDKSGSTAVCAFVGPERMYIANCGDSRAVLCRSGRARFASRDHKPAEPLETRRIVSAGGAVITNRVNGLLGVSRALGDFEYKRLMALGPCQQLVSPEPDVHVETRDQLADEFLILACDGVWDVMGTEEAVQYVRYLLELTDDLVEVGCRLLDTCLNKGSMDNVSVVLVAFPGLPRPSAAALQADQALDQRIRARAEAVLRSEPGLSFHHLLFKLGPKPVPGLPPGAGLAGKREVVEAVYKELNPGWVDAEDDPRPSFFDGREAALAGGPFGEGMGDVLSGHGQRPKQPPPPPFNQ